MSSAQVDGFACPDASALAAEARRAPVRRSLPECVRVPAQGRPQALDFATRIPPYSLRVQGLPMSPEARQEPVPETLDNCPVRPERSEVEGRAFPWGEAPQAGMDQGFP